MKTKLAFYFLILLLFITGSITEISAQVTVGTGEETVKGAILQLKEKTGVTDDAFNAYRGLGLPRVTLSDKHQLYPMFLTDPDDPASGPNAEYSGAGKTVLDKSHTGLIVYNLVEDEDKDLCLGFNQWDGEQWNCFQQKPTSAQFTFDCATITAVGDYGNDIPLNSSHYLRVTLTVTRVGSYSISATASPDNGYFFETTGTFYSPGTFTITIPGTGKPANHSQGLNLTDPGDDTPDHFTLVSTGGGSNCNFDITVRSTDVHPEFDIECGSIVVEGMYFEDQPLSATPNPINGQSHRLAVTIKNTTLSYGAVAMLQTNTVDGISFKGEAMITSDPQVIYMQGTGIPRGLDDKLFTITTNSETSTVSCEATVYMLIPAKRLLCIGNLDYNFGYNLAWKTARTDPATGFNSGNDLLTDKNNFGYNQWSIVKFAGFSNVVGSGLTDYYANRVNNLSTWTDDGRDIIGVDQAYWINNTYWPSAANGKLDQLLNTGIDGQPKIDIVMIGYSADYVPAATPHGPQLAAVLTKFVQSGGILMICSQHPDANQRFFRSFFNDAGITSNSGDTPPIAENLYTFGYDASSTSAIYKPNYCKDDDPILAGPFEDVVGKFWAEDSRNPAYIQGLPTDSIIVYSGARYVNRTGASADPEDGVLIFRHKRLPLVFMGDGGFNSNDPKDLTRQEYCPFYLTSRVINGHTYAHYPTYKQYTRGRTYNAVFTANAFAWCIYQAEEYRRLHK
jgi:hypothetical protein